ncbi:hypothetical protein BJX65DRAFT_279451 [Aspergillus insuetus]
MTVLFGNLPFDRFILKHWDTTSPRSREEQKRLLLIRWIGLGDRGRKQYFHASPKADEVSPGVPQDLLTPAQRAADGDPSRKLWIRTWFGKKDDAESQVAAEEEYRRLFFHVLQQGEENESYGLSVVDEEFIYDYRDFDAPDTEIRDGNVLATPWSTPTWLINALMRCPDQLSGTGGLGVNVPGDDKDDEDQQLLIAIADRKACVDGWVLLVGINHKGQILPVRVRDKATEVDLVVTEWDEGASLAKLYRDGNSQGGELYLHDGDGWE